VRGPWILALALIVGSSGCATTPRAGHDPATPMTLEDDHMVVRVEPISANRVRLVLTCHDRTIRIEGPSASIHRSSDGSIAVSATGNPELFVDQTRWRSSFFVVHDFDEPTYWFDTGDPSHGDSPSVP